MLDGRPCHVHPDQPIVGACNRCGDFGCRECLPDGRRCFRCEPAPPVVKPDANAAFRWVFQDPDYVSKILVGSACALFGMFLLPLFCLLGYQLEIARRERRQPQTRLPDWGDWGRYAWDGFKFYACIFLVILTIEAFFALVFVGLILVALLLGQTGASGVVALFAAFFGMAAILSLIPLSIFVGYAFPALQLEYLRTGSVLSGFHVKSIWRLISRRPGEYFVLFITAFAARFVANVLGQLLCLVGILLTAPWALYTEGWLVGRYWAWLDSVEPLDS